MKLKIDNDAIAEEFFEDTRLFGVMAPIPVYQFVWQLNNGLRVDFRINNDIEIQLTRKNRNYYFSIYQHREQHRTLDHFLYCNHYDGEYLLPEFRHMDFLWLAKGDPMLDDETQSLVKSIRGINGVQLVTELTNEKIRNKQHLIF
ncbi:MAG: IPExxxVDY family protein [Bacteroidetes bacterium]|nr:IPExxxVDY family protein [Bacteroidota bacterium]